MTKQIDEAQFARWHGLRPPWYRPLLRKRWDRLHADPRWLVEVAVVPVPGALPPESLPPDGLAERVMAAAKDRRVRQHAALTEEHDQLAAWVDLQNGVPLYYPARMKGRSDGE